jgi:Mg2+-importing ATPase
MRSARDGEAPVNLDNESRDTITAKLRSLAAQGLRAVAVATKTCATPGDALAPGDEAALIFEGFCTFADPPKESAGDALKRLAAGGVRVKVLSGEDPLVARGLPDWWG